MKTKNFFYQQSNLKPISTINIQPLSRSFTDLNLNNDKPNNHKTFDKTRIKKNRFRELGNRGYVGKMRKTPFLGILFGILYAFFMSTSVALLKVVPDIHPIAVLVYRSIIQIFVFLAIAFYNQKSLFGIPEERTSCAGRAVSGMLNQIGWYTSVKYISLTDSSAIYYSAPVFVTVLAYFMLGETFGTFECVSVLITVIGVTLVSKPRFIFFLDNESTADLIGKKNQTLFNHRLNEHNLTSNLFSNTNLTLNFNNYLGTKSLNQEINSFNVDKNENYHLIGMFLALLGAITFALSNIYIRQMKKTPTEITAIWFSFVTILSSLPLMYLLNIMTLPKNYLELTVVILIGIFSVLGQVAFTLALKIEKAGTVSVAQTLNIVIVLFYQIVFFQNPITFTSLIGVFLIIISVMIIGLKDILINNHYASYLLKKLLTTNNGQFNVEHAFKCPSKNKFNYSENFHLFNANVNNDEKLNSNDNKFFFSNYCIGGNCKNNNCINSNSSNIKNFSNNNYSDKNSEFLKTKLIMYNKKDVY